MRETCAYCGGPESLGFNRDHVVPKSLQKKLRQMGKPLPPHLCGTVWSCWPCNIRKGARHLIPESWADRLDELNNIISGTPFRVWHGDTSEEAYSKAWAK